MGHSFKDWLCPDSMEFSKDNFRIDGRFGRVLYLQGYASYIRDSMITELCELNRSLMLSIDILPVPTDEAVREIQNKLLGVETNVGATNAIHLDIRSETKEPPKPNSKAMIISP